MQFSYHQKINPLIVAEAITYANRERVKMRKDFEVWKCAQCGKEAPATCHQKRQKYCSKECLSLAYVDSMKGENNPNFKNSKSKQCTQCGSSYESYSKTRKFCSMKCSRESKRVLSLNKCCFCSKEFKPRLQKQKFCDAACFKSSRTNNSNYKPRPRLANLVNCQNCGEEFKSPKSAERKYCGYECFLTSGGAKRAGEAAVMAKRIYGNKKDANHNEIFSALEKLIPVKDLSDSGFGVPDGLAWVNNSWQLFDVKNPKTAYGRRGLNDIQKKWASDWRGGAVYLIHNIDEALLLATGKLDQLKKFPDDSCSARQALEVLGVVV